MGNIMGLKQQNCFLTSFDCLKFDNMSARLVSSEGPLLDLHMTAASLTLHRLSSYLVMCDTVLGEM